MTKCRTCQSPDPHRHPAVQLGGEVQICRDDFHLTVTAQNRPEYRTQVIAEKVRHLRDELIKVAPSLWDGGLK